MEDKFIGIDISKQTFDTALLVDGKWKHLVFDNNSKGFSSLLRVVNKNDIVVMEASGPYYLPLANFLFSNQVGVVIANPLSIKRFAQMRLQRAKTDKKDARTIAGYAIFNHSNLDLWKPKGKFTNDLKQLQTTIENLQKQVHQSSRQLEAFQSSGILDQSLEGEIKKIIRFLNAKLKKLEQKQSNLAKEHFSESMEKLQSIPGIGKKTAIMLIALTDDFNKFDHYKQLIAYVGFSPRVYQSGSSVKGKGHICKMGNSQIRKLLYLCSWSAKKFNKTCKEMYERLAEKGKPERVIKIALANKLLKQAFAIMKSGKKYDKNYQPKACF